MKDRFKHYHIIENLDEIYKNAIIVLDTNSILNIYRYNTDNRNKYIEILKKVTKRIYLTHQICTEFYKNRFLIIENRTTFKENIYEMISENQTKLLNIIENCTGTEKFNSSLSILKHETILKETISNNLKKSLEKIKKSIDDFNQDLDISYIQKKDPILDEINLIVGNKISSEFSKEKLNEIFNEGEERYKAEIPPGYKDSDKEGNSKYNDLVIWKELIDLSKSLKKNILFISDDRKDDWAMKFKGKDFGPRNELLKEFIKETDQLFYSITTKRFIEIISSIHSISNTELLIKETENITKNIYEKEKQVIERLELLRLEREKFEKELLRKKLYKRFNIDSKPNEKDNIKWDNDYNNIILENKDKSENEIDRKNLDNEIEELKNKFIWNFLKENYISKSEKKDDNEGEGFRFTFE